MRWANKSSVLCVILLLFSFLSACGSDSPPELVDSDFDGIWDIDDEYPGDTDNDGIVNDLDEDDDNDGVPDAEDAFPFDPRESGDADVDGIGNNADPDDDNDNVLDADDIFPLDANEWEDNNHNGIGDNADLDDDGDGFTDIVDWYPRDINQAGDHDGDGIDSLIDSDDDGDGYSDEREVAESSNPLDANSKPLDLDGDGLTDAQETAWGSNPKAADTDSDNLSDKVEYILQTNPTSPDSDGDGINDSAEVGSDLENPPDFDGDGKIDALDFNTSFEFRVLEGDPQESHNRFGVSADASGNIYIANYLDSAIHKYSKLGAFIEKIGEGALLRVNDVCVKTNAIYVADTDNNRILKLNLSGQILQIFEHQPDGTPGGFAAPKGIDVDASGNVFVADTWNNRIQRYDVRDATWSAAGVNGANPGEFLDPQDIAVSDEGAVAVADTGNFRVQLLDSNLNFVTVINSESLGFASFDFRPRSLSFSPTGELFIADDINPRVIVVTKDGILQRTFGSQGSAMGEFQYPAGLDVDESGSVFLTDRSRAQVF